MPEDRDEHVGVRSDVTSDPALAQVAPDQRLPRPAAHLAWTVELDGIALWRRGMPRVLLQYPEAAAWDLVTRGMARTRAVRLLAELWDSDETDAAAALDSMLGLWLRRGWLDREGGMHG